MKFKLILGAFGLLLGLAACGPADTNTAANDALATATTLLPAGAEETAAAIVNDPTTQAVLGEIETALADPALESTINDALAGIDDVTLAQGETLTLDALSAVPDITNYKMTVVDAPEAAAASEGKLIKEASDGNISLSPEEYQQYFTTAGDYRVRLDLTTGANTTATHEFTITVP